MRNEKLLMQCSGFAGSTFAGNWIVGSGIWDL